MKNLANCKPSEFLSQTVKIRKSVKNWIDVTDIANIRMQKAVIPEGADKAQIDKLNREQTKRNLSEILDAIMEKHPKETLDLLALLCFVEPENVDDYPMEYYFEAVGEMLGSEAVIGFFTSLVRLGQTNISEA